MASKFYEGDVVTHSDDVNQTLCGDVVRVLPSGRVVVRWDGLTDSEFECEPDALTRISDRITPIPDVDARDFDVIAAGIADLVSRKNQAYGDSFNNATKILGILFPDGVSPDAYGRMLYIVRVLDKIGRISQDPYSLNEDAFRDIAGYSILAIANE